MKFRTELLIKASDFQINLQHRITSLGSCFSSMIGGKMSRRKSDILINPFGVTFHPISIFKHIEACVLGNQPIAENYLLRDEVSYNYLFHSEVSSLSSETLEEKIQGKMSTLSEYLKTSDYLFLTFGTSIGYVHNSQNILVANCHKQDKTIFRKELFSSDTISKEFEKIHSLLQSINPDLKIILTVSPVRHLKEGLVENSLSKSILRVLCHDLCEKYDNLRYFPSYELLLDDLRDYRFFAEDLLHPSAQAEDYIWEKFQQAYFNPETINFQKQWTKILHAINHRPFYKDTSSHVEFKKSTITKILKIKERYGVDVEAELEYFK